VGIIEAGQMVAHGDIKSMKLRLQPHRHLCIRVLGDNVELAKATLGQIQGVLHLDVETADEGDWDIRVQFSGDKLATSQLLQQLVMAQVPVLAFTEETDSLEDVFMKLTEGIVS
jgi:ABC-type uncharacterized transport system ATPase subunit